MDIFQNDQRFFKGNLHMHTTRSDGTRSPKDAVNTYREHGYDFVALTDHNLVGNESFLENNMLVLSGIELDYTLPGEELHIVGIGIRKELESNLEYRYGPQHGINQIRRFGGRAIIAHPAWSLNSLATLSGLQNVTAAEIYNSMSTAPRNCLRADSSSLLDMAASHGHIFSHVAVDDAHFYEGEHCKSFVMVQAPSLTQVALLEALDNGRFYASQGPIIKQLSYDKHHISIACSPVSSIIFYSNLPWVTGRCRIGENLTESVYDLTTQEEESFVRCQIIDQSGNSAWTNPIVLADIKE